jgi:hypothetical protein
MIVSQTSSIGAWMSILAITMLIAGGRLTLPLAAGLLVSGLTCR